MSIGFTVETMSAPSPPRITDHPDRLMLIHPRETTVFQHPDGKTVDAVVADLVVLDAEEGPLLLRGVIVTQKVPARTLRRRLDQAGGERVSTLARLVRKPSHRDPAYLVWLFDEPTQTDVDLAELYLEEHGDPFDPARLA